MLLREGGARMMPWREREPAIRHMKNRWSKWKLVLRFLKICFAKPVWRVLDRVPAWLEKSHFNQEVGWGTWLGRYSLAFDRALHYTTPRVLNHKLVATPLWLNLFYSKYLWFWYRTQLNWKSNLFYSNRNQQYSNVFWQSSQIITLHMMGPDLTDTIPSQHYNSVRPRVLKSTSETHAGTRIWI